MEKQQNLVLGQNSLKREGSSLQNLQKQIKSGEKPQQSVPQEQQKQLAQNSQYGCIWGIQKFMDQKQCYKNFRKGYPDFNSSQAVNGIKVQAIAKQKSKNFFIIKFAQALSISFDQFNTKYGKNKRVKVKPLQNGMNLADFHFVTVSEINTPGQKNMVPATQAEIEQVKNQRIQDIVASYHSLPYPQQVQKKVQQINKVVEVYNTQFFRDNQVKRLMNQEKKQINPLKMHQFIECPQNARTEYRSKSQFTIGKGENGDVVIGFNKGNYKNNTIMVESPKNVNIISKNSKLIVAVVENFIRTNFSKQLKPFDRVQSVGFWRYLIVRESNRTGQSMVMVVCKTECVDVELLNSVKEKLTEYCKVAVKGLQSLCFLSYNGQADCVPTQKPELLFGTPYYNEKIFDHTFQVSPSAFLQINIPMCEILYEEIIKAVRECDVVLDLGSGIGTIGISIKNRLPNVKVIGIQICEEAVEDSKKNCPEYQVHLGRAQDHIKTVCEQYRGQRIVAILDPPRAGFNKDVLVALRRTRGLDNIIYVACNAKAIQDNLLQLTLPVTQRRKAPEFVIKKMLGLDLFPQTPHFEALYVLERV